MAHDLVIIPSAKKEIRDSLLWHKEQATGLDKRFNKELQYVFNEIIEKPDLFQKRYRNVRIRFMEKLKYGVHYEVRDNLIIVLAVLHSSRKPKK